MFIDPDKKIEKIKKERPGIYQSSQHPEHFDNEGEEYLQPNADKRKSDADIPKTESAEKSKGAK